MTELPKKVQDYLDNTAKKQIGAQNTRLIADYLEKCAAMPSQPSDSRLWTIANRMKKVSLLLKNKALNALTEKDLQDMNLQLRAEGLESAADYRKILKHYFKTMNKKKFSELIFSDFLKNPRNGHKLLVDPNDFWTETECNAYLRESQLYKPTKPTPRPLKQAAWAGLWLSTGCRPHELLGMHKKDIVFEVPQTLIVRVGENTKTGKRSIVLQGNEAAGTWHYVKPHWESLKDNEPLFDCSYNAMKKVHNKMCDRAHIAKDRKRNFYIARKKTLTHFYQDFGIVKAASMAGHIQGSSVMKHYVAMNEDMLKANAKSAAVQLKTCPNPSCGAENEPHESQCKECGSPLDRKKFSIIFERNTTGLIEKMITEALREKGLIKGG